MSELSTVVSSIMSRVKQLEDAIAQSLANHNALLGAAQEAKTMLDMATKAAEVVIPTNPATIGLEAVDKIVDEVAP